MTDFKKEARELNTLLAQHQILFCLFSIIHDLHHTNSSLVNQLLDIETYFDDIEEKIAGFLTWYENFDERLDNLPRIEESHKEIIFGEWEIHVKNGEATVFNAIEISNNPIEVVTHKLFQENIISNGPKGAFPNIKPLTKMWLESCKNQAEVIEQLSKIDLESDWKFLVKPHS